VDVRVFRSSTTATSSNPGETVKMLEHIARKGFRMPLSTILLLAEARARRA